MSFKNSIFYFSQSCNKNELFPLSHRAALKLKECADFEERDHSRCDSNFYSNTPELLFSDFFLLLYIDPLCILTQNTDFYHFFRHAFFILLGLAKKSKG